MAGLFAAKGTLLTISIDLSPVEDVRYAKELYRRMIPLRMRWVGLATTRIAEDRELLKLASQSGCRGLLIGFEAIDRPRSIILKHSLIPPIDMPR